MRNPWRTVALLLLAGCSAASESGHSNRLAPVVAAAPVALPRLYWVPDMTTRRVQAVVPGARRYYVTIITRCLNDSAVVNRVLLDDGPALDVSHNYVSEILITRQGQTGRRARLTKELFQQDTLVRKMGPLSELVLSRTEFLRYEAPDFLFAARVGVPDSDIFATAQVALGPDGGLRVVSVQPDAGAE